MLAVIASLSALALRSSQTLTYVVFPALMWAALRLGRRGATLAVAAAAGFAIWETTRRQGPFAFDSITGSVLATQLYLAVSAITTLCVAAVGGRARAFARNLSRSRARLVEAATAERRRIERDLHDGVQQRLTALLVRLRLAERARGARARTAGARLQARGHRAVRGDRRAARAWRTASTRRCVTDHGLARALQGDGGALVAADAAARAAERARDARRPRSRATSWSPRR